MRFALSIQSRSCFRRLALFLLALFPHASLRMFLLLPVALGAQVRFRALLRDTRLLGGRALGGDASLFFEAEPLTGVRT